MRTALAGIFATDGSSPGPGALRAALGPERVNLTGSGPLAVAAADRRPARGAPPSDAPICVLDGHIPGLDALADEIGMRRDAPPETVLATAYVRLGDAVLGRLRGDWVLVLWDPVAARGLLARDPMGGRGLHFCDDGARLLFGSEPRELLRLVSRRPAPDPVAMAHWLAGTGVRSGRTFYEGIRALEAGHLVALDRNGWRTRRFWAPVYRPPLAIGAREATELVAAGLTRAVADGLEGAGGAGVLLSGGLDSASVAAVARRRVAAPGTPLRTYSALFPSLPSTDESALVAGLRASLQLPGTCINVEGMSMLAGAIDHLREWELPLFSHNDAFWQPLLARARADGVSVMLDGEGGDVLFAESRELVADRLRHGRPLAAVGLVRRLPGAGDHPPWRRVARLVNDVGLRPALHWRVHALARGLRGAERHAPPWLSARSARLHAESHDPWAYKRLDGPLWWRRSADALTHGLDALGARDHLRRRAASAGLEARQPLYDRALVELVLSLPPELAYDPHRNRPLLRSAVAGIVPDEVRLRRTKSNFAAVLHSCLTNWDLPAIHALLHRDAAVFAYADGDHVRNELLARGPRRYRLGFLAWAYAVWRLAVAELWLAHQSDPGAPARLLERASPRPARYTID